MKEFQICDQLAAIRGRLERDKTLRETTKGGELTAEDKLLRSIFEPATRVARSDSLIDTEEIVVLNIKIGETRDFLFRHGQDFTQHPEYPELNPVFVTSQDIERYKNLNWYTIGEFQLDVEPRPAMFDIVPGVEPDGLFRFYTAPVEVSADKTQPEEDPVMGARLRMKIVDNEHYVYIKLGFDDTYMLTVSFFDIPEWSRARAHYAHPSELEYTADLPIANMTQEEADVIHHYMSEFMTQAKEKTPDQ